MIAADMDTERPETTLDTRDAERAREGDREAFERLVLKYRDLVYAVANRIVDDFYAAEDICQEAFLTAFLKLDTLKDPRAFAPWLKQIAVRKCIRYVQSLREKPAQSAVFALADPLLADDEEQTRGHTQWIGRMEQAIEELSEKQCEMLDLFYVRGLSHAEIAHFLGVPMGTVKRRLFDVRQKLKEQAPDMPRGKEAGHRFLEAFRCALAKRMTGDM